MDYQVLAIVAMLVMLVLLKRAEPEISRTVSVPVTSREQSGSATWHDSATEN